MGKKKRLTNQQFYVLYGSVLSSQLLVESSIEYIVKDKEKFKDLAIINLETVLKNLQQIKTKLAGQINFGSLETG